MAKFIKGVLAFIAWKSLDFLLYTLLCAGAVWLRWRDAMEQYTFSVFLQTGYLRFWEYGVGYGFVGVIAAIAVCFICIWLNGYWNLKAKQKAVGRDVEKRAAVLAATMRTEIEAEVAKSNKDFQTRLREWQNRLAIDIKEVGEREEKVDAYRKELKALRETHKLYACNHEIIRQRGQRALEVLEREAPCIGEAKRLVRKIIKLA